LARAIRRLLEDDDLREQMGTSALARARSEFSAPVMIERVTALYDDLLNSAT
jgi:glycosyltransferase involved in cell wall biosynthesis